LRECDPAAPETSVSILLIISASLYLLCLFYKPSTANRIFNTSSPGFKFADWELKGVPLRLEFGPKDDAASVVSYARRDTGSKGTIPIVELATVVPAMLETIQQDMYDKADASFKSHRLVLTDWTEVVPALDARNVVLIPFCEEAACEERIKEMTKSDEQQEPGPDGQKQPSMGMKSLCIPFEQVRTCDPENQCNTTGQDKLLTLACPN
jgi:prolyl-tRNA synthetase